MVQWQPQRAKVRRSPSATLTARIGSLLIRLPRPWLLDEIGAIKTGQSAITDLAGEEAGIGKANTSRYSGSVDKGADRDSKAQGRKLDTGRHPVQVELLELIELYTETLIARFALLEQSKEEPDGSVADAVTALIYAAPHTELKELHIMREMLMQKFGRNYAVAVIANDPPVVPPRIVSKVSLYVPPQQLVEAYLEEIARGYGLAWRAPTASSTETIDDEATGACQDDDTDGPGGGVGVKEGDSKTKETLAAAAEPAEAPAKISKIITEDDQARELLQKVATAEATKKVVEHKELDEYDALAARFEALKKR
ncbi:hypothetical protein QFC19_001612 [Naganishia cerealis]|uniref:Uncharacterized protein n=1 Tax=Naganishia cerealis TaxID=610337 RepID=A0ACC2WI58_9TREE|nr:hypothetical protein QFC19_001612 [Naganishia cerealis]